jgi:hypothetical protein
MNSLNFMMAPRLSKRHMRVERSPETLSLGHRSLVGEAPPLLSVTTADPAGEFGRGGRLARALQPDHGHDARAGAVHRQRRATFAEQPRQLVVHDLHDLLAGRDGLEDRLAERPLLHALQEVARDLEVHIRLEQDAADLAEPVLDHRLRENATLAQLLERRVEPTTQLVEHDPPRFSGREPRS